MAPAHVFRETVPPQRRHLRGGIFSFCRKKRRRIRQGEPRGDRVHTNAVRPSSSASDFTKASDRTSRAVRAEPLSRMAEAPLLIRDDRSLAALHHPRTNALQQKNAALSSR